MQDPDVTYFDLSHLFLYLNRCVEKNNKNPHKELTKLIYLVAFWFIQTHGLS